MRRTRAAALLVVLLAGLALAWPASGGAHAFLIRSVPAPGARLGGSPGELRLYFSEPIVGGSARVTVHLLGRGEVTLPRPAGHGAVLLQRLPSRQRGVYVVDWHVLANDGHITQGENGFAVGRGGRLPALRSSVSTPTPWGQVAAWWVILGGLAVAVGGLASELLVWRRLPGLRAHQWAAPVGLGIAAAALGAVAELVLLAGERAGGGALRGIRPSALVEVSGTRPGALTVACLAALAVASVALRRWRRVALLPLGAVVVTVGLRTHAGTSGTAWAATVAALHLAGALLWVGALVHLVVIVARSRSPGFPSVLRDGAGAYSRLALPLVLAILASGVVVALDEFHRWAELIETGYGRTLMVKSTLVGLALLLALGSRLRALPANPGLRVALLRRLTRGEVLALAAALAAASALGNTAPPVPAVALPPGLLGASPLAGPAVQVGDLAGNLEVGVAATATELRFTVVTPSQDLARGVRLTATARPPNGRPVDLFPRACGPGCFTIRYSLRPGVTPLTVAVSRVRPLRGGETRFELPAPVPPASPGLLRRVLRAMGAVRSLQLREYVTSGPGSTPAPRSFTVSGSALLAEEAYSADAADVRVLGQTPTRTDVAFALPGSYIYYRLSVDRADRIRSATIISPGHLIQDTITYPRRVGEGRLAAPDPILATPLQPPSATQLAVAEQAGPWIAAAWLLPSDRGLAGTMRLLDFNSHPVGASISIPGAETSPCGSGCVTFRSARAGRWLRVVARLGAQSHEAAIPVRWHPDDTARARGILDSVIRATGRLRSFRIAERLSGAQGPANLTDYRIAGPQRFEFTTHPPVPTPQVSRFVEIGRDKWFRSGVRSQGIEHNVAPPVNALTLMPWWAHRSAPVRLLDVTTADGDRIGELALADLAGRGISSPPFWFRLRVDLRSHRVIRMRMIAPGHFMLQRYFAFGSHPLVLPPA